MFYLGYGASVIAYGALMLLLAPLLDYPQRYRLLMVWNRFALRWLRLVCGIRHRISGLENLPATACVVVSNHQSSWETIFLATLFPQLCILLKRELLRIPFFGWALAMMRPIAIDRDNPRAALKQVVEDGAEGLKRRHMAPPRTHVSRVLRVPGTVSKLLLVEHLNETIVASASPQI